MAKLTKTDVTVETELPTEIAELESRGFRTAEDQQRIDAAAKAAQKASGNSTGSHIHANATSASATDGKPATGKSGK